MTSAAAALRVLVLGAGSAGARHARLLAEAGATVTVADPDAGRAEAVAAATPGDRVVARAGTWTERIEPGWDAVVVASPSAHHAAQAAAALEAGTRVLVEKPLATSSADAEALAGGAGDRLAVAYNLRYHPPLRRVAELVHGGGTGPVRSWRLWFGQYLPDWRPGVDYRSTYSARRDLGGGILLDASHELDLLQWLAGPGPWEVRGSVVGTFGDLALDVEDTAVALLTGTDGVVASVSLDCLSRRYRRGVEAVGAEATVRLDWSRQVLEVEDGSGVRSEPADAPVSESYRAQAVATCRWLADGSPMPVSAADGAAVVALAERIRVAGGA